MKRLIHSSSDPNSVKYYLDLLKKSYESGSNYRSRFQYLKDNCKFWSTPVSSSVVYSNSDEYSRSQTNAAVADILSNDVDVTNKIEFISASDRYSAKYSHSYIRLDKPNFIDNNEVYNYLSGYSPVTNCICSYNDVLSSARYMIKSGQLSKIKLYRF